MNNVLREEEAGYEDSPPMHGVLGPHLLLLPIGLGGIRPHLPDQLCYRILPVSVCLRLRASPVSCSEY